jgi:hypothetical protein
MASARQSPRPLSTLCDHASGHRNLVGLVFQLRPSFSHLNITNPFTFGGHGTAPPLAFSNSVPLENLSCLAMVPLAPEP